MGDFIKPNRVYTIWAPAENEEWCHSGCDFLTGNSCAGGWNESIVVEGQDSPSPTADCPGPGTYMLTKVDGNAGYTMITPPPANPAAESDTRFMVNWGFIIAGTLSVIWSAFAFIGVRAVLGW